MNQKPTKLNQYLQVSSHMALDNASATTLLQLLTCRISNSYSCKLNATVVCYDSSYGECKSVNYDLYRLVLDSLRGLDTLLNA